MAEFYKKRKKVCYMCAGKDIDYKDVDILKKYYNTIIMQRRNAYIVLSGALAKW